jgi:alkaline phosphatase D
VLEAAAASADTGIVALSGDLHDHVAGVLRRAPHDPASAVVGADFVATSIGSEGDGAAETRATRAYLAANPHVQLHDNRRGSLASTVEARGWLTDFKALDRILMREGTISTMASFRQERASRTWTRPRRPRSSAFGGKPSRAPASIPRTFSSIPAALEFGASWR